MAPFSGSPDPILADVGIDHLLLTNGTVGVDATPRAGVHRPVQLAPPAPNPSRGPVALTLETFEAGPVQVEIVDASGRVVRHAEIAGSVAGPKVWSWNGADDQGRSTPPGYYRARAWSAAGGTSRPLIRVR